MGVSSGIFLGYFLPLLKYQFRWAGHVSRIEDHRIPMNALYGKLSIGHREIGAQKKRYKDCLKKSLTACNVDPLCRLLLLLARLINCQDVVLDE